MKARLITPVTAITSARATKSVPAQPATAALKLITKNASSKKPAHTDTARKRAVLIKYGIEIIIDVIRAQDLIYLQRQHPVLP